MCLWLHVQEVGCAFSYHSLLLSLFEGAKVSEDFEGRAPLLQLQFPIEHDGGGYDDQVRPPVAPEHRGRRRSVSQGRELGVSLLLTGQVGQ